ncbi:hypothetical protein ACIQUG_27370 [Ensifer sp. NPDC090286]|uniref:hypothetical protein n=1 Tax=Ensifer sp. NPDC090286 TaxID=3363991 RepID=UPI00383AC35C
MSVIGTILIAAAEKVAAPLVKSILVGKLGRSDEGLVDAVIDKVAGKLGVEPEAVSAEPPERLEEAVRQVEAEAPEMLAVWEAGLKGQFALLQAEQKEGFWPSAWRWGWMYLLAVMWFVRLMIVPVVDAIAGFDIASGMDFTVMMTLTGWFISLYMGGHTLKELGTSAVQAVKAYRQGGRG